MPASEQSLGQRLRAARREKNLTLADVAEVTKIPTHFLRCLEEERYGALPDQFRLVSFMRQYAEHLGIDKNEAVAAIQRVVPPSTQSVDLGRLLVEPQKPGLINTRPIVSVIKSGVKNQGRITTLAVAIALIVGGAYWGIGLSGSEDETPEAAEAPTAPTAGPVESDSDGAPTPSAAPSSPSSDRSGNPESTSTEAPTAAQAAPSAGIQPQPATPATDSGSVNTTSSPMPAADSIIVELLASEIVWLRILADGREAHQVMLRPGDRHRIAATDLVQITFGNAGGARMIVNGVRQRPVGASGAVQHVQITKEGWRSVPPGTF